MTNTKEHSLSAFSAGSIGTAGSTDASVRSDLFVSVEYRESGGVDIQIRSIVGSLFGTSIRTMVEGFVADNNLQNVSITLEDRGALPFVIAARVEAACRRAGFELNTHLEHKVPLSNPTAKDRTRRSRLYLPGNTPKFMINAGLHKPDGIILDLEDSVHPDEKDAARLMVRNALRYVDFYGAERMVRINQLPLGFEDLDAVVPESPDLILIPKVEGVHQVQEVHHRIKQILDTGGIKRPVWLMPILESAMGIEQAFAIAQATQSVVALTIGLEDLTADLGVIKTVEGHESLYARMRLVNAARAAGIQAIDSVFGDVGNLDGLADWAGRSRALGFEGMGCIHPRQIKPIHDAFAPSAEEIDKAIKIVAAFDEAQTKGLSVVRLGTRMVDPPVVLRAQRLVEAARRTGRLPTTD